MTSTPLERIDTSLLTMTKELASTCGIGGSKKLSVTFNQGSYVFILTKGDEEVYRGTSSAKAVDMYNEIKSRSRSKTHTIEHFQASELEFSNEMASSFGRGKNKSLSLKVLNCTFTFEVKNKGKDVYTGTSAMKAVDVYNEY